MSKYTTEVRFICENANDLDASEGYLSINEIITNAIPKVFNFDFPIFDESYREVLERKILKHFYTREICEETVGLWKLRLDTKLNEIMPYYNKLYESELLEFNPLYTANLTRTRKTNLDSQRNGRENISDSENKSENGSFSKTGTVVTEKSVTDSGEDVVTEAKTVTDSGNDVVTEAKTDTISGTVGSTNNTTASGSGSGTNSNLNTDLYSDTPQGALTGVDNESYLTNARKVSDSGSSSSTTSNTSETVGSVTESKSDTLNGTNRTDYGKVETTSNTNTTAHGKVETTSNTDTYNISETSGKTEENSYQRNRGTADNLLSTEDYLETVVGYEGANASKMLKEFRDTFLNIDMQVINELEVLFFQLW